MLSRIFGVLVLMMAAVASVWAQSSYPSPTFDNLFVNTALSVAGTPENFPASGHLVGTTDTQGLTNKTVNGLTITASTGTLTVANGKTAAVNNTLTLAGTDSTTMTMPTTSKTLAANDLSNVTLSGSCTNSGAVLTCANSGRTLLASNKTYYFNCSTGSNSNSGTSGSPFADPVYAYEVAQQTLDLGGQYSITVIGQSNCSSAAYTFVGPLVGAQGPPSFIIEGSSLSITITGAGAGFAFQAQDGAAITVEDLTCNPGAAGGCFLANGNGGPSQILTGNLDIGTNGGASIWDSAGAGAGFIATGTITLSNVSSAVNIVAVTEDNSVGLFSPAVTLNGSPSWTTAFVQADINATMDGTGFTSSGSAVGPRYVTSLNGCVFTGGSGGASFFPGNSGGSGACYQ